MPTDRDVCRYHFRLGSTAPLTITAMPVPTEDVEVLLQIEGSGGEDVSVMPILTTIRSGQSAAAVTVTAIDDLPAEMEESATITMILTGQGSVFAQISEESSKAVVTVPSNDTPTIAFAASTLITLAEGSTAPLTITAMPVPTEDVEVLLQLEGSGGEDVSVMPIMTTIRSGQSAATVTVTAKDDGTSEREEKVTVRLELVDPDAFARIDEDRDVAVITIAEQAIRLRIRVYLEGALSP